MSTTAGPGPSWYDVLGVEPDASTDQIRTAWRESIADLDPGDRRFQSLNRAAEVLLDEKSRAAYDAQHREAEKSPTQGQSDHPGHSSVVQETPTRSFWFGGAKRGRAKTDGSAQSERQPKAEDETQPKRGSQRTPGAERDAQPSAAAGAAVEAATTPRRGPSAWLLAPLAILTALAVAVAAYLLTQPSDDQIASDTTDAQSAAERAAPVILAYDYRRMDADEKASEALMTGTYAEQYEKLFAVLKQNAPTVKPEVTAEVLDSGIVRTGDDGNRVEVVIFVNQDVKKAVGQPTVEHQQAEFTMEKSGGDWLVDNIQT